MLINSGLRVPFGYHKKTGNYMGIDEVSNGLACGCYCPSCDMQLVARNKGEKDRAHHFAHHRAASVGCEFSYWVAVRSMAKQLIETYGYGELDLRGRFPSAVVPFLNSAEIEVLEWILDPRVKGYHFDVKAKTTHGVFYIHFLTAEDDEGRYPSHRTMGSIPNTFAPYRVLEIDLSPIKEADIKNITSELKRLIISLEAKNKDWFIVKEKFLEVQKRWESEKEEYLKWKEEEKRREQEQLKRDEKRKKEQAIQKRLEEERRDEERKNREREAKKREATRKEIEKNSVWPTDISYGMLNTLKRIYIENSTPVHIPQKDDGNHKIVYVHNYPKASIIRCCGSFFGIVFFGSYFYYVYKVEDDKLVPLQIKESNYKEAVYAIAREEAKKKEQ